MSLNAVWTFLTLVSRIIRHWNPEHPAHVTFPFSFKGHKYRLVGDILDDEPKG